MKQIKLSIQNLCNLKNTIEVPKYPLEKHNNMILHLGVGNFHRSHQAYYLHKLLQNNSVEWCICGAGLMPQDIKMKEALASQDYLYTLITQEAGKEEVTVIGSIRDFIHIATEYDRFLEACTSESLKIISLTITEKGYCFNNTMNLDTENDSIKHDLIQKDESPISAIGVLVFGLQQRMLNGAKPLTILSCDNIPENGNVLKRLVFQFVEKIGNSELLDYLKGSISFPCTMVDRITPTTTEEKRTYLIDQYGVKDAVPVFSEQFLQWVIEDDFKLERPAWEKVGATFVKDVKPYELMKIRLLNGGHSALSYLSLLAGYYYVDDAMNDKDIWDFVYSYMNEVKATLIPINGIDYDEYIQNLLRRFVNEAVRDRLLRLAEDGSTKFVNCTISPLMTLLHKEQKVPFITTALAAWIVYLRQSVSNTKFEVKDPIAEKLQKAAAESREDLKEFLTIQEIFPKEIFQYKTFIDQLEKAVGKISEEGAKAFLKSESGKNK